MHEQGRAAVLGWQQTVDAAWNRQSTLLAVPADGPFTGPGEAELDAARREFFGPADPGAQRTVLQTGARIPGGKDGIIVSRFYIADQDAAFGTLYGDGRGPSTDPNAGYRFSVAWDTLTGEVSLTVNPSTIHNQLLPDQVVPARPINTEPGGDPNNFVVDQASPGHLTVSYNVLNSVIPVGQANGTVDIGLDPNTISLNLHGDNYPDGEFIQYRPDGTRMLFTKDMSPLKEAAVVPGVDPVDQSPFTVPPQTVPR
jgi:hypothetical protein